MIRTILARTLARSSRPPSPPGRGERVAQAWARQRLGRSWVRGLRQRSVSLRESPSSSRRSATGPSFSPRGAKGCRRLVLAVVGLAVLAGCTQFTGAPKSVAPALVEQAQFTLNRFRDNEDLRKIDVHIPDAAGIMILPSVVKGGFIGAAEAGSGVLLARRPDGSWSYPAFYLLGGGSVGLQLGLQETEIVMIIRNRGALEAVIRNQGKVGADIGVTVGIRGIGYEGSTTTNLGADILAFTRGSLGAFGGASLEGAALVRRNDLNEAFYEPGAEPRAIVIDGKYRNPAADMLRNAIEPK